MSALGTMRSNLDMQVVPIFRAIDRGDEVGANFQHYVGTGFILAEAGLLFTCWHCVDRPCEPGEAYFAMVDRNGDGMRHDVRLHDIEQDRTGLDIAIATIDAPPPVSRSLTFAIDADIATGVDVSTYGYSFTTRIIESANYDEPSWMLATRLFKGYLTTVLQWDGGDPHFRNGVRLLECDFPAPAGTSGSPIVLEDDRTVVVGMIYGDWSVNTEGRAVLTLARGYHVDALLQASAAATGGETVEKYLRGLAAPK